jgi:Domain of unknown function (DUF4175)
MPEEKAIALITSRLKKLGGYILSRKLLFGLLMIVAAVLAAVVLANLSHWLFYLPTWYRTAFVITALTMALVLFIMLVVKPLIKRPSNEDLALLVEKKNPELKNRLIASLQLEKKLLSNRENYSPALIKQCIAQADSLTGDINFSESYKSGKIRNGLRYFGLTGIITVAVWLFSPGLFSSSLDVFSNPLKEIPREIMYNLAVTPESSDVLKYDDIEINAVVFGSKLPKDARIYWKVADAWRSDNIDIADITAELPEEFADPLIGVTDTNLFTYEFKEIRHDFKYYVESGERTSQVYDVRVVDKPRINNIKLTYHYPKYTGLAPVVLDENDGTIQALKGTRVKIEAELNKAVESGKIVFDGSESRDMEVSDTLLKTSIKVTSEGSYHIEVVDNIGHTNPDPIEYRIFSLEDSYPQIQIVKPGGNIDLDDYLAFDLGASLSDDFGFSRLTLHYMVYLSPTEVKSDSIEFKFDKKKTDQLIEFYWDLSNLGLYPGSYVDYYMELFDNDNISGPKSTMSRTYTARHPTIEEMFVEIEEAREDMITDMIEAMQEELRLQEAFEELNEDLQFQDEVEWETQKDIEKATQDQTDLMEKLNQMAQEFEQINEQAKQNDMLTLEMIQKLNELQKLFDQVATPEMKEAMKKLQEAMEKMDKNELEQAMKEFEMSTEDMIQNLERAIAQLKKFQVEQKMQAMIAMAEKILENQDKVNEETAESKEDDLPSLKNKEDRNKEDVNNLKKNADELRELLKENELSDDQSADQFCQSVEKTDVDMDMQEMSDNLKSKDKQSAEQSGETSSAKLEDLLSQMKESQAQFNNQMSEEMAEKMRNAIDDILYLSEEQEGLYNEIMPLSPRSQMLPDYAEEQQNLKSEADRIRAELQEIAKQSAFIQAALDKFMEGVTTAMDGSVSALTNLNGRSSTSYQSEGIYKLNQSAQTLIESLNSESQCNSSCSNNQSMFKKMKKLSKGQNKVNRQTQSSCQNPSDKPGKPGKESLRRLAAQQSQIRNGIAEMQDEFGDRKDVAGRLDKLGEEMKKVIEALESGDVNPGTLENQKNIYSRMLDFQLSLERRDYSEKRRADKGDDFIRRSPEELELQKRLLESEYRARLEKFMDESYPPEYESLIRDYYKALMQNQK